LTVRRRRSEPGWRLRQEDTAYNYFKSHATIPLRDKNNERLIENVSPWPAGGRQEGQEGVHDPREEEETAGE
jgi:hypothetical protein